MRTRTVLTAEDAAKIMADAKAEAMVQGWNVSIAVVDEAGVLLHLERMDGAGPQSPEVATQKARTAALAKVPTKALEELVKERPAMLLFPGRLPLQGGVPVIHNGECVGGIGVSGVKSHEDEVVALAGLKAVSA